jgi:alpha-L-rhamnosidase
MNSFNHYSFGAVYEWMTAYQLGICADPAQPGYQHFILQPTAGGSFRYAKGSFESPYGTIASGWTAEDGKMTSYDAFVPANTSATLYLPVSAALEIPQGMEVTGTLTHNGLDCICLELPAGSWHFGA